MSSRSLSLSKRSITEVERLWIATHKGSSSPSLLALIRIFVETAIGSLVYLMVGTRPDITFALGTLSRFTSRPQSHHQAALHQLLRYIKVMQSHRISYRSGQVIGYTDADSRGSVVTDGAYSTSGCVFQLAGTPVS
ncbi:hypothetical protein N7478_010072 [Penicillium angulare]|uniref:uncharacterized protein n=1 Tax=Penicillium angulare TaxID=116970 RepID=UPI0025401915|nr:uncharacterized protein N7478_010072 [Penicillium angulare]KAJ5267264.1 hypothetical protein N7478_010072 [Penicillium angulare]